jgi:hypothetical protein
MNQQTSSSPQRIATGVAVRVNRVRPAAAILLAALLLPACSGGDDSAGTTQAQETTTAQTTTEAAEEQEGAGEFVVRVNDYIRKGQFRRAWLLLHPAQKKVVRASTLSSCLGQNQWPPNAKLKVTETYPEPWDIPGGPRDAASTAVTIQVYVQYSEEGSDVTSVLETFTQHAFQVGRAWAWILAPDTFQAAGSDSC